MAIDIYQYWSDPPPTPSPKLAKWVLAINGGWTPNRRISQMGYEEKAEFFGVYLWEYLNVIYPLINPKCGARFELANGETVSPCCLPVGHEGDHRGTVLGSGCSWPQGFESEEEMYFRNLADNETG